MMEILNLPIDVVSINGGTQSRVSLNEATVSEYAEIIRLGGELPPVIVFEDGTDIWLGDGFHRFHAYRQAGAMELPCDVRSGTKRDAILFSCGANASHGLRRTNEDKRKAVMTLLGDAEWAMWSDNAIAKACSVSDKTVTAHRTPHFGIPKLESQAHFGIPKLESQAERTYTTKHGTQATMSTANIGKSKLAEPQPTPVINPEKYAFPSHIKDQEPTEVDALKAEIADLREQLAQAEIDIKQLAADNNKMGAVFDADDRVSAMAAELKKQTAIALCAETTLFTRNNEFNAALKQAKLWESKHAKLEKKLQVAA